MSWVADYAIAALQRRPLWVRLITGLVRNTNSVVKLGSSVFLLRAEHVRDVLERATVFEIGEPNGRKMLHGPFLLGMDEMWQRYRIDRPLLASILGELSPAYVAVNDRACDVAFTRIREARQIDVVSEFVEPVVVALAKDFYGLKSPKQSKVIAADCPDQLLGYYLRVVGSVIAFRSPAPFGRQKIAERVSKELAAHLTDVIDERKKTIDPIAPSPTVIDHLILHARASSLDDAWIHANLAGLVLAGSTALVKALCHTIHQLLQGEMGGSGKAPLKDAIAAESYGNAERVAQVVWEALRHNPTFPLISRYCPGPDLATVALESSDQTPIAPGTTVVPVLISAMFDELAMEHPEDFRAGRDTAEYLHFGYGTHQCLGTWMASQTLVAMVRRLLRLERFGEFSAGRLIYDGVAVDSFVITRSKG